MQVTISARHGHLSTGSQERIEEKVRKLQRFYDRITSIQVTVDLKNEDSPEVEVRVTAEQHPDFVATDQGAGVATALDLVIPKLESQLRKHKDKVTGHRSPGIKHLPQEEDEPSE